MLCMFPQEARLNRVYYGGISAFLSQSSQLFQVDEKVSLDIEGLPTRADRLDGGIRPFIFRRLDVCWLTPTSTDD